MTGTLDIGTRIDIDVGYLLRHDVEYSTEETR